MNIPKRVLLAALLLSSCHAFSQTPGCPNFARPEYPDITTSFCIDSTHAWVALYELFDDGWNPSIAATDDGGKHWAVREIHVPDYAPESLFFFDERIGWVILSPEEPDARPACKILVTKDGSATWAELRSRGFTPCGNEMLFISPKTGWMVGPGSKGPGQLWVTHDRGADWTLQALPSPRTCQDCRILFERPPIFGDSKHGELTVSVLVGRMKTITVTYVTANGGGSWKIAGIGPCN